MTEIDIKKAYALTEGVTQTVILHELRKAFGENRDPKLVTAYYLMALDTLNLKNLVEQPNSVEQGLEDSLRKAISSSSVLNMDSGSGHLIEKIVNLEYTLDAMIKGDYSRSTKVKLLEKISSAGWINKEKKYPGGLKQRYDFILSRSLFDFMGLHPERYYCSQEAFIEYLRAALLKLNPGGLCVFWSFHDFTLNPECLTGYSKRSDDQMPIHIGESIEVGKKLGLPGPFDQEFEILDYFNREIVKTDTYATVKMIDGQLKTIAPAEMANIWTGSPGYMIIQRKIKTS